MVSEQGGPRQEQTEPLHADAAPSLPRKSNWATAEEEFAVPHLSKTVHQTPPTSGLVVHVEDFFPLWEGEGIRLDSLHSLDLNLSGIYGEGVCVGSSSFASPSAPDGFCFRRNGQVNYTIGQDARTLDFDEFALERVMLGKWLSSPRCMDRFDACRAKADIVVVPSFIFHFMQRHAYTWKWVEAAGGDSQALARYWGTLAALYAGPERSRSPVIVMHHAFPTSSAWGYFHSLLEHLSHSPPKMQRQVVLASLESNVKAAEVGLFPDCWSPGAAEEMRRRGMGGRPCDAGGKEGPLFVTLPYPTSITRTKPFAHLADRRKIAVLLMGSEARGSTGNAGNWIRSLTFTHMARRSALRNYSIGVHDMSLGIVCVGDHPGEAYTASEYCGLRSPAPTALSGGMVHGYDSAGSGRGSAPPPRPSMWELTSTAVFCIEPAGDSLTRGHVYIAVLMGCIPVLLDGGHDDFDTPTWWAWRDNLAEGGSTAAETKEGEGPWPFVNYQDFAVVFDAKVIREGGHNVVDMLRKIAKEEPERVKRKQAALDKVAHLMHYADPSECGGSLPACEDAFSAFRNLVTRFARAPEERGVAAAPGSDAYARAVEG